VSDVADGQLDDPLHAGSRRRGCEPLIVCGDVEPVGEQEHRVYAVDRGCQVALAEIGDGRLGAVGENRAGIAGEDPYVTCLGGEERCDEFRTDIAGGSGDQNHESWSFV
jgi:hypothetical protein